MTLCTLEQLKHKACDRSTHVQQAPCSPRESSPNVALAIPMLLAGTVANTPLTIIDRDCALPRRAAVASGEKLFYVEYSGGNIKTWDGVRISPFWHQEGCGPSGLIWRGYHLLVACYDGKITYWSSMRPDGKYDGCEVTVAAAPLRDRTTLRPTTRTVSISPPPVPTMSTRPITGACCTCELMARLSSRWLTRCISKRALL